MTDSGAVTEAVVHRYGDHDDAFGELTLPGPTSGEPAPVVVLVHGGFWRDGFFLDLMRPLVPSLVERGWAVWNIEYRRVGAGGGHPETFDDVARAVDLIAALPDDLAPAVDPSRVAIVGHSAGGHLAVWATSRAELPPDAVGADPAVTPVVAVPQAGVLDLARCAEERVGGTACPDLLGVDPAADPELVVVTSPIELVPLDVTVVAVHGSDDTIVPLWQSTDYVERAAEAGADASFVVIDGADHFDVIDPTHEAWQTVLDTLERAFGV